jgi:hypothetical protein
MRRRALQGSEARHAGHKPKTDVRGEDGPLRLAGDRCFAGRRRLRRVGRLALPWRVHRDRLPLPGRDAFPKPHRHGPAWLRAGRVPILQIPAARAARRPQDGPLPPPDPSANDRNERTGTGERYPETHEDFLRLCHESGQIRPTPLLLQYGPGDFNALHQDLYGDLAFPIQAVVLLSEPGRDFTGGEFVLTEQRPRMQSKAEVVPLRQGDGVAFAVHNRPVQGARGYHRVNLRHGVSRVRSGLRHTAGIIFHDAK